ncbi:MAG TPA: lipase family protein [Leucothrix mucor]|uniref:Lipase family protein n=1 Tax=Leucothrix mucor TaxID=45248 RepID=A0A7V2SZQ3_LEUMU|nr:lipase family protein [Leucothrix mucor]
MKFNVKAFGFSIENANFLARASNLVYDDFNDPKFTSEIESWGFKKSNISFFDSRGTQAFLVVDQEKIIIAFRGTEPDQLKDWVTDAKVRKTAGPYGDVHRGFANALSYVWSDIENVIDEVRDNRQTIWLTGHSLGAALATLATGAIQTNEEQIRVSGLYTFGSPRVGSHRFAKLFNQDNTHVYRFVNNSDIVTRVPLSQTYSHVGSLMYFNNDGELIPDKDLTWWNMFWDRMRGGLDSFLRLNPVDGITDHSMDKYEENIKNASR